MIKLSINKHNPLEMYKMTTLALIAISISTIVIQLFLPISIGNNYVNTSTEDMILNRNTLQTNNVPRNTNKKTISLRTGLFKSAVALKGKPLADKTIDRIKSQLKLQCIMTINGQLVAYIDIKGVGFKQCAVGDSVSDMFTVLNINKTTKCVDISIIDHKVTLYL